MQLQPIYTENNDCRDCYKCIRECPTKAIKVCDSKASVIDSMCIYCGQCVSVCPTGAKKVRDGIAKAKLLIKNRKEVYVSLAPSYIVEFGTDYPKVIHALKQLGFKGVSETALGAQEVSKQVRRFLEGRQEGTYISSACPVVVEYIRKYYPQHSLSITPFMSPMLTHAKQLRKWYGNDIGVVFIGPCIGKKAEADTSFESVDAVLTFDELQQWLKLANIDVHIKSTDDEQNAFIPCKAQLGTIYPTDGGMAETIKSTNTLSDCHFLSYSGLNNIKHILENWDVDESEDTIFLELLACETGCLNGPGMSDKKVSLQKQLAIRKLCHERVNDQIEHPPFDDKLNIERDFFNIPSLPNTVYTEENIAQALLSIGKRSLSDELNCSGCGYDTCRDFAKALLQKYAEPDMCVSYMRTVAHHKATVLLQKIPSGVVVVDDQYNVVEMNQSFAKLIGGDVEMCYDNALGMRGAELDKLVSFTQPFKTALITGKEYFDIPIKENGKQLQLSIFNIQKNKLVTGIIQGTAQPEFQKDIIEKRTREVINKNMETVQKIAFLLGENASYTDSLLNSILESQDKNSAE